MKYFFCKHCVNTECMCAKEIIYLMGVKDGMKEAKDRVEDHERMCNAMGLEPTFEVIKTLFDYD